jgi:hypothetical protein
MEVTGQLHVPARVHLEKGVWSTQRKPYLVGHKVDVYFAEKIISAPAENLTHSTQPSH